MKTRLNLTKTDYFYIFLSAILGGGGALAISNLDTSIGLYGIIALLGIAAALAIFVRPSLGANILIVFVFTNISAQLTNAGFPSVNKPLVVLVAIAIGARYIYIEKLPVVKATTARIGLFLFLFFIFVTASYIPASSKSRAIDSILDLAKDIVIIYIVILALRSAKTWKQSVWIIISITFMLALMGVYQSVAGNYEQTFFGMARIKIDQVFDGSSTPRLGGPINDPNMWGQVLVSVIALLSFRIFHESNRFTKFYALIVLGALLYCTMNTYSRGAYLALGIVAVLIIFFFEKKINFSVALIGVAAFVLILPFLPAGYIARLQSLASLSPTTEYGVYEDSSFRGRISEILTGLSMFTSNPLLGVGAGNFANNYQQYTQLIGIELRSEERDPHSLYVELLAENGAFGFLAFMGIVITLLNGLSKSKREIEHIRVYAETWSPWITSIQVSLIGYLIAATFLHGAFIRYFWILVALGISAIQLTDEMINQPNNPKQKRELN